MGKDLAGKVALVTGATSGIGRATASEFARMGARTLLVARDPDRARDTADAIRSTTGATVEVLVADLSSREAIRALATRVREAVPRLDLLVNNAGAIFARRELSADGVEMTFALNHLGYFLLTHELLPLLRGPGGARIVNVASSAHATVRIDFDDLQGERRYSMWRAYAQSKLANVLFTRELARRLAGTGVIANAVHPGAVASGFGRNRPGLFNRLVTLGAPFLLSPERGARTVVRVAADPRLGDVSGRYFAYGRPWPTSRAARDDDTALRLWQISEAMTQPTTRIPTP